MTKDNKNKPHARKIQMLAKLLLVRETVLFSFSFWNNSQQQSEQWESTNERNTFFISTWNNLDSRIIFIMDKLFVAFILFFTFYSPTKTALAEARDISIHLNPLQKHFSQIEETDFAEAKPLLEPLMHIICMVWSRSRYYCQSSKITVLLRQICNLLIHQVWKHSISSLIGFSMIQCTLHMALCFDFKILFFFSLSFPQFYGVKAKRFLDPSTIFHTDIDEAMQRITQTMQTLKHFRALFDKYKEKLDTYFIANQRSVSHFDWILSCKAVVVFDKHLHFYLFRCYFGHSIRMPCSSVSMHFWSV